MGRRKGPSLTAEFETLERTDPAVAKAAAGLDALRMSALLARIEQLEGHRRQWRNIALDVIREIELREDVEEIRAYAKERLDNDMAGEVRADELRIGTERALTALWNIGTEEARALEPKVRRAVFGEPCAREPGGSDG